MLSIFSQAPFILKYWEFSAAEIMEKKMNQFNEGSFFPQAKAPPKILVIEDDADTRFLLFQALSDEGHNVIQAEDGKKGLESLKENLPDLILLDIMMPGTHWFDLGNRIRSDEPTMAPPLLIITAKDEFTEKMKGFQAGGDDYITKPFILSEVLARIRVHLRIQKLKKDLAMSEKQYRLLIENSPDGIISISPGRELLFHNSRFVEILRGKMPDPLTGRILQNLFPLSDMFRELSGLMDELVRKNSLVSKEIQMNASNKETVYLEIVGMPVTDEAGQIGSFLMVIRDITQRKKMEDALIQAEKINSLGILTAGIAHEVNNPLTCISNAVQILKKTDANKEKSEEICNLVLDNVNRIAKIIRDLRIFSRPQETAPTEFSVSEAIAETISLMSYQSTSNKITKEFIKCEETLIVFGDRGHFQQVMINLLVNATQAIEKEGKISVTLSQGDNNAIITVEDTGCGIPPDQLGQLFNPFFTTKRAWKGTGLGLAVSFRIIQLFKGNIKVNTAVGKGTRFTVYIPLLKPRKRNHAT